MKTLLFGTIAALAVLAGTGTADAAWVVRTAYRWDPLCGKFVAVAERTWVPDCGPIVIRPPIEISVYRDPGWRNDRYHRHEHHDHHHRDRAPYRVYGR